VNKKNTESCCKFVTNANNTTTEISQISMLTETVCKKLSKKI